MSVTEEIGGDWLTVGQVASACHVSERTVRRWVAEDVVRSRMVRKGLRESRLILREGLPAANTKGTMHDQAKAEWGSVRQAAESNEQRHELSLLAATQAERDHLAEQVRQLQERLAASQHGEEQLRQILVHAQQMNLQLSEALIGR